MDRRGLSLLAVLGCGALLLLVLLPIGLLFWAFGGGGLDLNIPPVGDVFATQNAQAPDREQRAPVGGGQQAVTPQVPQTGGQQVPLAEPVIQPPESLAELYDQVSPGTVSILVGASMSGQMGGGAGSGFLLTEDGYIVTNDHVVEGGDTYIVRFFNDIDVPAEVVGVDPDSDLAIIRVEELPEGARPLPLGDSNGVRVGDSVVAIGNPFGLGTSMSYGIISALGRTIPSITQFNIPEAIQTDAAINPGNSGGPLINMRGEVIGVNAQIRTTGEGGGSIGIGFAIPVNILKQVYPSLISEGRYTWAYLGVSSPSDAPGLFQPDEARENPDGAFIAEVVPGGPADQAGLQSGDVVLQADDQEINSFDDLLSYIAYHQPGDQVQLLIDRNGQQQQLAVTLGERPSGGLQ